MVQSETEESDTDLYFKAGGSIWPSDPSVKMLLMQESIPRMYIHHEHHLSLYTHRDISRTSLVEPVEIKSAFELA